MAELRKCVNAACGAAMAVGESKKGWGLRSGGFAELCNSCGMAYEKMVFCDMFHPKETGWRECHSCSKRLHCGCIASESSIVLLDGGGVQCMVCMNISEPSTPVSTGFLQQLVSRSPGQQNLVSTGRPLESNASQVQESATDGSICGNADNKIIHGTRNIEVNCKFSNSESSGHMKREPVMLSVGDSTTSGFFDKKQVSQGSFNILRCGNIKYNSAEKVSCEMQMHTSIMSLGTPNHQHFINALYNSGNSHVGLPIQNTVVEEREQNKQLPVLQSQRSRHLLPKPPKTYPDIGLEEPNNMPHNARIARPPADGRGKYQLLPRYWPRITDEELQQMTGDPNSTIIPLFEKILSVSDAGRIGRLVLPKACAEAYFPPISHPEGLPLKIQDVKGNNWVFQFRFWPNNNSRMYVLEGVTPCMQSLQLQAGDTVTFSQMEPGGKLIMGFRKATNSAQLQDSQISAMANAAICNENLLSGATENMPIVSGYPGVLQSPKVNVAFQLSDSPEVSKHTGSSAEELRKRGGHIGSKSKRLHIDYEDAMELKLTWEEAQDLLRPPLSAKPSIVMIEDHEFEEYEEPPVLGKRTIFTAGTSGLHQQWAQCDSCFKWRRLPADITLSSKWTCAENLWDSKRSSCTAPAEINLKDMQNLIQINEDVRRQQIAAKQKASPSQEASGLDALAIVAAFGDDTSQGASSAAKTTKHPRHRPGCTCIVCIQPPSGKGPKHKPTCTCNVCTTVRRRFNTLMLRKKKRQLEQQEETPSPPPIPLAPPSKRLVMSSGIETEEDDISKFALNMASQEKLGCGYDKIIAENLEKGNEHLNLNFHPLQKEDPMASSSSSNIKRDPFFPSEHASSNYPESPQVPEDSEAVTLDQRSYLASKQPDQVSSLDKEHVTSDKP